MFQNSNINLANVLKEPNFCVMPFAHLMFWPNGNVAPCCTTEGYTYGNTKQNNLDQIISPCNTKLINFRKQFLNASSLPEACKRCTKNEKAFGQSYRLYSNNMLKDAFCSLDIKTSEQLLNNKSIISMDTRFSNLCNLMCRYCDENNSSRIAQEKSKLINIPILLNAIDKSSDFFDYFEKNLSNLTHMYFCGGEPLLLEQHYELLEILINAGKTDVHLTYNTNGTTLSLKGKNIIELWKQFQNITIAASIDCTGEKLSYIRHGAKWNIIKNNLIVISKLPNINIYLTPVITVLNILEIKRLYEECIDAKIISEDKFNFHLVEHNPNLSLGVIPKTKRYVIKEYLSKWITELSDTSESLKFNLTNISSQLDSFEEISINEFYKTIDDLDKKRNESFSNLFPEVQKLLIE